MPDFSQRSPQHELMDGNDISFNEFDACLQELETINHLTFAYGPTLRWLKTMRRQAARAERLTVLDVGSGYGDMLRMIQQKLPLARQWFLTGADINPWSKQAAGAAAQNSGIVYEVADIFSFAADRKFYFIISSLFTHHLNDEELVRFIRWMDAHSTRGWLINDLHRHWLPYYFIKAATEIFSRNRLIRHDAAVSVARAFTRADWQDILQQTGIPSDDIKITWHFPFRYTVACQKR